MMKKLALNAKTLDLTAKKFHDLHIECSSLEILS